MATAGDTLPPFSARNRRDAAPIDGDFPASARIGILHLISEAIQKDYLEGWAAVALELQRIARVPPQTYRRQDSNLAQDNAQTNLESLPWERMYDFCERLYSHLARQVGYWDDNNYTERVPKTEVQLFFSSELQRLFQEENLAFEFREGHVQRRGRRHTVDRVSRAETVLADIRLDSARKHFTKAQRYSGIA
jgi:hypothetical protein